MAALKLYAGKYDREISKSVGSDVERLAQQIGRASTGVYNKLMNFRSLDPRVEQKGLGSTSKIDRQAWEAFWLGDEQRLDAAALDLEYARRGRGAVSADAVRDAIANRTAPAPVTPERRNQQADTAVASEEIDVPANQDIAEPYVVARFRISHWGEPHEASRSELIPIVEKIVSIEGPIHQDEVARRVAELWGKARTGNRIQAAVLDALNECRRTGSLKSDQDFWTLSDVDERPKPRSRSAVQSVNLKKVEYLPPAELESAVLELVSAHAGMTLNDLQSAAPRMLGFDRSGAALKSAVDEAVARLTDNGLLVRSGAHFVAAKPA